ncbi:uncharacterized protein LOC118438853 isoform X3 [Folsomia candida]|uniref:uncharacterized protein LOC118438853 isoform X3 n=1 Tax=Folsomia candida TaxID=158441 RepID=UPI001604A4A5|nr:uncharacterized protein LOC118438853 isoform X3 [Folsomia candida]
MVGNFASSHKIDEVTNLNGSKVYVLGGTRHIVVNQGSLRLLSGMYKHYGANVLEQFSIPVGHGIFDEEGGFQTSSKVSHPPPIETFPAIEDNRGPNKFHDEHNVPSLRSCLILLCKYHVDFSLCVVLPEGKAVR